MPNTGTPTAVLATVRIRRRRHSGCSWIIAEAGARHKSLLRRDQSVASAGGVSPSLRFVSAPPALGHGRGGRAPTAFRCFRCGGFGLGRRGPGWVGSASSPGGVLGRARGGAAAPLLVGWGSAPFFLQRLRRDVGKTSEAGDIVKGRSFASKERGRARRAPGRLASVACRTMS